MICMIEISSDESLSDNIEPVFAKMRVTKLSMTEDPEMKLSANGVNEMKNARFACGVKKSLSFNLEFDSGLSSDTDPLSIFFDFPCSS